MLPNQNGAATNKVWWDREIMLLEPPTQVYRLPPLKAVMKPYKAAIELPEFLEYPREHLPL